MLQLFASSQEFYAAVSEDNRLKVWEVSSGALQHDLKERDHLSYKYTAIAWTQTSPLLKGGAKRAKTAGLGLIALGTSTGAIVVWDLQKGEVVRTLSSEQDKDAHGAAVNDVAFNAQGNLLYSCSSEKNVLEWNLKQSSVSRRFRSGSDGAQRIAVSANDEVLAVGGTSIRTFDLSSGKKARKLVAGLSSNVSQLFFSNSARFLFSSTVGGRFVNLYDLDETESDEPAVNFSMPSAAASLFARTEVAKKKKATDVLLSAVSTTGSLFLWTQKHKSGATSTKPVAPDAKSVVAEGTSAGILTAQESVETKNELIVVRGSIVKPVFERVTILDAQNQLKEELEFTTISENLLLADSERDQKKKQRVAADAAEKEQAHVPTLAQRSGLAKGLDVVDASASGFDDLQQAPEDGDDNDLTLAERVEALRERVESDLAAELVRVDTSDVNAAASSDKPDASSLSSVLEQALQSKDNAMLEYCLRTRDAKVIGNTIKRVASVKVLELLEILVLKFEKSPGRCARLCPWIRSILLHHTAYLMTQPDLVQNLSALYQILENRLKVHDQLQKLAGRLSLVIGQIHEAASAGVTDSEDNAAAAASGDAPRASIVYREGEEDDEAEEDDDEEDAEEEDDDDEEEQDDDDDEDDE
uniref:Small-subunit processome Utp12 domain-containing protein n=1 Tax=Globisporangium ultimum (strain ATCC 200006 / CBS 805.95 / DAOM BR144) TaxID=431595 RepID=K3WH81_GLOUD